MDHLDLFSGIGGFALGLEWASRYGAGGRYFKTVAFCEADPKCRKVLKKHWPGTKIYIDVTTLTKKRLAAAGITAIDVITGGFPCQDISLAGNGVGIGGSRSSLWKEFARLIGEVRPLYAIIENVSALRSRGLEKVICDLAAIGYDAQWHCIPASAVGAPHQRDRIWIVAGNANSGIESQNLEISGGENAESTRIRRYDVPNPDSGRCEPGSEQTRWETRNHSHRGCRSGREKGLADSDKQYGDDRGYEAGKIRREQQKKTPLFERFDRWQTEPPICGVAHGFPGRVDRLKQLGNAVVPQIPYLIGLAIMAVAPVVKKIK